MKNSSTVNTVVYRVILASVLGLAACSTKNDDGGKDSGTPNSPSAPIVSEKSGTPDQRQEAAKKAQEFIQALSEIMKQNSLAASDCLRMGILSSQLDRFSFQLKKENRKESEKDIESANQSLSEVGATNIDRISGFSGCTGTSYVDGLRLDLLLRQQTLLAVIDLVHSEDLYLSNGPSNYNLEIELRRTLLSISSQISFLLSYEEGLNTYKKSPNDEYWKGRFNEKKSEYFFQLGKFISYKEFAFGAIVQNKKLDSTAVVKLNQILINLKSLKAAVSENDEAEIENQKTKIETLDQSVQALLESVQK